MLVAVLLPSGMINVPVRTSPPPHTHTHTHTHKIIKAVAGFERIGSSFERSPTVSKMLSNSYVYYRDIMKGRVSAANFIIILFLKLPQPPQAFSSHRPDLSAAMNVKARPSTSSEFILTEGSGDSSFFFSKKSTF